MLNLKHGAKYLKHILVTIFILLFSISISACNFYDNSNENSSEIGNTSNVEITITTKVEVLDAYLFNTKTARAFLNMLPLTVTLWDAEPNYARAFDLANRIERFNDEPEQTSYELGSLAYWYNGPSIAIIYNDNRDQTVVPVVPIGKIISDVGIFFTYNDEITIERKNSNLDRLSVGIETYKEFVMDNVYHSLNNGDIHFHSYFPSDYDEKNKYALFISLPGYNGLYFQGVGANIKTEDFVFEAQKYIRDMIIIAPQLNDWQERSANQVIDLTEFILDNFKIDFNRVYIDGYSGGGETLSLVLSKRPDLYSRALHIASIWDGTIDALVNAKTPIYFVIGKNDEYYGSSRISNTYSQIVNLYLEKGLSREEINNLVTLDIKDSSYFIGAPNQHGGIGKVSHDENIMNWLFKE